MTTPQMKTDNEKEQFYDLPSSDPDKLKNNRAKVSRMGDKIHIIIPAYHKDVESLVDEFVDVETTGPQ